jgi:hypothetical protein
MRVIKSRRIRWAGHVAGMGEGRDMYRVWLGNLRERDHLRDLGVDVTMTLRWIFRKWKIEVMEWIGPAQDRDRWRTLVNAVMNLRVP